MALIIEVAAIASIVAGVALVSVPAALIAAGVLIILAVERGG